jgi:hypothetical protein
MVLGLVDPNIGWAESTAHFGSEGELSNWGTFSFPMPAQNPMGVKAASFSLVTYEPETQAKYRDAFVGAATVDVADVDAPKVLSLEAPKTWVTGASAGIGYGFEDTGLGVRAAGIRLQGETELHSGWGADFLCSGTAASPCPRRPQSSQPTSTLGFIPNELPTGEDELGPVP